MRNLSNKIWNATRFVKEFTGEAETNSEFNSWIEKVIQETTSHLDKLRIGQASEYVYNEFWHGYCDRWIEEAKKGSVSGIQMDQGLLVFLKLLHPFMPFVTESCYQQIFSQKESDLLITSPWPTI
jgi:valyl-tRNA synthetase